MNTPVWGVIGGTGFTELEGFTITKTVRKAGRFGEPSAPVQLGRWNGTEMAFIPRHGDPHRIAPHLVNYRANIWALKQIGVESVIGLNAVGGIRADCTPASLVIPDQVIDYTWGRISSFSDTSDAGVVHIDFTEPYTESLRAELIQAADNAGVHVVDSGIYAATQGPRLETAAEIARLKHDGNAIVGMTGMPEACLAREAELRYAQICMVANWGAGLTQGVITMDEIHANMKAAGKSAMALLNQLWA